MVMNIEFWWGERSYWDTVSDNKRHHGRLSETQEASYAVFILHVKKHFGQLDTDLRKKKKALQMNMNCN